MALGSLFRPFCRGGVDTMSSQVKTQPVRSFERFCFCSPSFDRIVEFCLLFFMVVGFFVFVVSCCVGTPGNGEE